MGKRGKYTGVQIHGESVRIWFTHQGQRVYEKTEFAPNERGLAAAARLRAECQQKVKLGIFRYADYFPDSPRAKTLDTLTFIECAERWFRHNRQSLALSTLKGYQKALNAHFEPLFDTEITAITKADIMDIMSAVQWSSGKTYNNVLTPLRRVFADALDNEIIARDPTASIKSVKWQKPVPDPFSAEEMKSILDWLEKKRPEWFPYFLSAFGSGMRTSELIALRWSDVDWFNGSVRVQRARTAKQVKNETKTAKIRDLEMTDTLRKGLALQKPKTLLAGEWVFLHPTTGSQINDDKPPRLAMTACLKSLGIRHRPTYNTRHTFATIALMNDAKPMWVSQMLGHSNMSMLLTRYSRWIDGADKGKELNKLKGVL